MLMSSRLHTLGLVVTMATACDNPSSEKKPSVVFIPPTSFSMPPVSQVPTKPPASQAPVNPDCSEAAKKWNAIQADSSSRIWWVRRSNVSPRNSFYMGAGAPEDLGENSLSFSVPYSLQKGKIASQPVKVFFRRYPYCPLGETDRTFFVGAFNAFVRSYMSLFLSHRSESVYNSPYSDRYEDRYTETVRVGVPRITALYHNFGSCRELLKDPSSFSVCMNGVEPDFVEVEDRDSSTGKPIEFMVSNQDLLDGKPFIPARNPVKK